MIKMTAIERAADFKIETEGAYTALKGNVTEDNAFMTYKDNVAAAYRQLVQGGQRTDMEVIMETFGELGLFNKLEQAIALSKAASEAGIGTYGADAQLAQEAQKIEKIMIDAMGKRRLLGDVEMTDEDKAQKIYQTVIEKAGELIEQRRNQDGNN